MGGQWIEWRLHSKFADVARFRLEQTANKCVELQEAYQDQGFRWEQCNNMDNLLIITHYYQTRLAIVG